MLGTGLDSFPLVYQSTIYGAMLGNETSGYARYAHNTYLEVLVGVGLVGLVVFMLILLYSLKALYSAQKYFRQNPYLDPLYVRTIGYCFLSFLLSLLFLSSFYHKYLWLFIGLCAVIRNMMQDAQRENSLPAEQRKLAA